MKAAIVMSSELGGRWDAGFHVLNAEYADRARALSVSMSKGEVMDLFSDELAIPTAALKCLEPLTRGNKAATSREDLLKAVGEYPFLALAIVKDKSAQILTDASAEFAERARRVSQAQSAIASTVEIPFIENIPLAAKSQLSKNKFVAGVVYFDGDTLSIPVETHPTAYVADCWVIELSEWTGPQMINDLVADGNVPVPRRHEDLGQPVGFVDSLADHRENYGMGWRQG